MLMEKNSNIRNRYHRGIRRKYYKRTLPIPNRDSKKRKPIRREMIYIQNLNTFEATSSDITTTTGTFQRITICACDNMSIRGFCCLEHIKDSCVETKCANIAAKHILNEVNRQRQHLSTTSRFYHGDIAELLWKTFIVSMLENPNHTIEIIGSVPIIIEPDSPTLSRMRPIILTGPSRCNDINTACRVEIEGNYGFNSDIESIFEIARGPCQCLYMCIKKQPNHQNILYKSTLRQYVYDKPREFWFVHVMVDCRVQDCWRYYGLSSQALDIIYKDLYQSGLLRSIFDCRQENLDTHSAVRVVLPLIHVATCEELGMAVRLPLNSKIIVGAALFDK